MNRTVLAAGLLAIGSVTPSAVKAESCPAGQIFRVSMGVCQPKSPGNVQWLKNSDGQPAMRRSAARPAVGDIVLFGSALPTLLKPSLPKPAVKKLPSKRVAAAPRKARAAIAAIPAAPPKSGAVTAGSAEPGEQRNPAEPQIKEKAKAAPQSSSAAVDEARVQQPAPTGATPHSEPKPTEVASAPPEKPAIIPDASKNALSADEDALVGQSGSSAFLPENAPSTTRSARVAKPAVRTETDSAGIEAPRQVRTIPLYTAPEPSPPAATTSRSDWGDEKKLVEALRADWNAKSLTRTFHIGEKVPPDIPLQPLPPPLASRDTGVNMHYLISNGDAVLVLPITRIVVDVYHSSAASLADR